jgi:hypothetical protein
MCPINAGKLAFLVRQKKIRSLQRGHSVSHFAAGLDNNRELSCLIARENHFH